MFAIVAVFFNHMLGKIKANREKHIQQFDHPENVLEARLRQALPSMMIEIVGQQIWDNTISQNTFFVEEKATKLANQ